MDWLVRTESGIRGYTVERLFVFIESEVHQINCQRFLKFSCEQTDELYKERNRLQTLKGADSLPKMQ